MTSPNAVRQLTYREAREKEGLCRVTVWVPKGARLAIMDAARALRQQHGRLLPEDRPPDPANPPT